MTKSSKTTKEIGGAKVKAMAFDVSTTAGAKAWLSRRIRKLVLLFPVAVVLSPVRRPCITKPRGHGECGECGARLAAAAQIYLLVDR